MISRIAHHDLLLELIELCQEMMTDVNHQLSYYRASVYKQETAQFIRDRVSALRVVVALFGDENTFDPFHDYDASELQGALAPIPGECSFSHRINSLLAGLREQLETLAASSQNRANPQAVSTLAQLVHRHRHQLLSFCRHGSRQWSLFHTL